MMPLSVSPATPDLDALELALTDHIKSLVNVSTSPDEPLVREVFNLMEEALADGETVRRLPAVGILDDDESYEDDELLGADAVSQEGSIRWTLVVLCDSPKRGAGYRGNRGARNITRQLMDALRGWQITDGCPVTVRRRRRFDARNEQGELVPLAGYVIEISHPV